jgi:hypothetical protein
LHEKTKHRFNCISGNVYFKTMIYFSVNLKYQMKKIIFSFLALPIFFAAKAQTDTSMHATAIAVCDCLTKANITDKSSQSEVQQVFLSCILKSAPDFMTKITSSGEDPATAGQELATKLAMEMVKNGCPAFTKIATAMMGSENDTMQMEMPMQMQSKVEKSQSIYGIVTKVE